MAPFHPVRVQIRLALQRTRLLIQKREAMAVKARRDVAGLIERGKLEMARVKTETIIQEDIGVELLEVLELYCELLNARIALLESSPDVDPSIADAVAGIIYAAHRTEVRELQKLRDFLMARYGRDYALRIMSFQPEDAGEPLLVPKRITSKLSGLATPPDQVLVDAFLQEIASAYNVSCPGLFPLSNDSLTQAESDKNTSPADRQDRQSGSNDTSSQPVELSSQRPNPLATASKSGDRDFDALARRFAALKHP